MSKKKVNICNERNDTEYLKCISNPPTVPFHRDSLFSEYEYDPIIGILRHRTDKNISIPLETAYRRAELLDMIQNETCKDPKKCDLKKRIIDFAKKGCELKHHTESNEEGINACIIDKLEQTHAHQCASTGMFKPDSQLCNMFKTRECMKKECSDGQCTSKLCDCCNGVCIWNEYTIKNNPCAQPETMTITERTPQPLEPNAIQSLAYTDENLCSDGVSCGLNEMLRENEKCKIQNMDQTTHLNMACFDEVYKKFSGPCSDPNGLGTNGVDPNSGICKQLNKTYGCVKMCLEGKVLKEPFQYHDTSSIPIFPFIFACIGALILIYVIKTF